MQKNTTLPTKRTLPGWAGWLIGYAATLAAAAGLVYFWRVIFSLPNSLGVLLPTLGVCGFATVLFLAVFLLQRFARDKLCLKAAAAIFVCGLVFCFATAPLQAPDEPKHFLRANAISHGNFTYDYDQAFPDDVHQLVQWFAPKMAHDVQYAGRQLAPAAIEGYWQALEEGETPKKADAPVMFLLLPFLHQGLFMAAARLLGFTALGQLYAGRIANLLLYAVLCYFVLKNGRRYRAVLTAMALLPLSLFMAASCSYDGLVLALSYFAVSFFCKAQFTARDIGVFLAVLMLATYIKPNSIVLVLVLLLIPKDRWKVKWRPWQVMLAAAAAAGLFWFALGAFDRDVLKIGYPDELGRGSGAAAGPIDQMAFILKNPLAFAARMLQSIYEADGFLFDLGRFGWMDLVVPLVGGLSVLCLCLAAALGAPDKPGDSRGAVLGLSLLGLVYGGAVLAGMYVTDTDVSSIRITGQQPRYFLPVFLLLFLAACVALSRVQRPRLDTSAAALRRQNTVLWTCAAVGVLAAVLVFQNYFVGQWLPKSQGGWKMVNLFGWQVT